MRLIHHTNRPMAALSWAVFGVTLLAGAAAPTTTQPPPVTLAKPKLECGGLPNIHGLAVSPDGRLLATSAHLGRVLHPGPGEVVICAAATGRVQRRLKVQVQAVLQPVEYLTFRPASRLLAAGLENGSVIVWDATTGTLADRFQAHDETPGVKMSASISGLGYSADGCRLLTASTEDRIKLWGFGGHRALVKDFPGTPRKGGVRRAALSRDGRLAAAALYDGSVQVWDVPSGKSLYVLTGHGRPGHKDDDVADVALSPDGALLATAGDDDGTVRLWDMATGHCVAVLPAQRGFVRAVAFSPDGQSLAAVGSIGNERPRPVGGVIVWDVKSHRERARFFAHNDPATAVAFLPDGQTLATVGGDQSKDEVLYGSVRLWDLRAIQASK